MTSEADHRVEMPPVILTCAVRYALGRGSYLPGLVADEVRRCWPHLGEQREVIAEDVRRWLSTAPDPWQHVEVWYGLHNWITGQ